jgi:enoyl-CoA hydratase
VALLEQESVGDVLVVRMNRPPANAMAPELLEAGVVLCAELAADPPPAIVLTGSGSFFSGGVDLKLAPTLTEAEQIGSVQSINELFLGWYGFPGPVVAAVNGHAVAGGLILALCADFRVAAVGARVGLTEARVGIPYPVAAMMGVKAELDPRAARRLVLQAELIEIEQAHELGVVDEVVEPAVVVDRAIQVAEGLAALPTRAYREVKQQLRGETVAAMRAAIPSDPMLEGWLSDETEGAARAVLEGD